MNDNILDFTPQKIFLAGDSCGGTLAFNICFQAIIKQIRLPDGLFLAYPALNLNVNTFSPSYMYSINDQLIPSKLLKTVLQAYIPEKLNHDADKDFFLTPLYASNQFFEKLPPIHMIIGEKDPLSDDSIRLVQKLQQVLPQFTLQYRNLNKHVKLIIYKYMAHGFLNFDIPFKGLPQSKVCVEDSIKEIQSIIDLTLKQ